MKKQIVLLTIASALVLGAGLTASADTNTLRGLPSPALKALVANQTFSARIAGYGWGEEDDVSAISLDFTVVEPIVFAADEVEALAVGDSIIAGFEVYTVKSVEEAEEGIVMTPEEEWLTPVTFQPYENGGYTAEDENGVLNADSFSFPGRLGSELEYVNAEGEQLTAAELLKDLVEGSLDTDSSVPKITFDEEGYIVKLDFAE